MTETPEEADPREPAPVPPPVLVPYARFLEWRARRRVIGDELAHPDPPPAPETKLTEGVLR